MQIIFYTDCKAVEFSEKNNEIFPPSPKECPFKDCNMPVKLEKHGYYKRFFISKDFSGILYIRRYICPICGRTVSMLPYFCISHFQYSALEILNILYELYQGGISLEKLIKKTKKVLPYIERRHINFYRKRIIKNRKLIQYVLNLMSPECIFTGNIPENQAWVKKFLEVVYIIHTPAFLVDFSKLTGKSFMTSQYVTV
ncbi:MAG TPA: hypothetical protein DIV40_08065 [Clostridiales bacterium]|jgi:transposase-like protein|nr:hypothetical protein [Clostridiales bacterium]